MIRNSLICKLINVQASMKENNEKKIKNCDEISKLIKTFPKDIAALDKRLERKRIKIEMDINKGKDILMIETSSFKYFLFLTSF